VAFFLIMILVPSNHKYHNKAQGRLIK